MSFCNGTTGIIQDQILSRYAFWCRAHLYVCALGATPWENPKIQWSIWAPLPVFTTLLHPLDVAELGDNWEDNLLQD
jgi:hypothetical protein